MNLINPTAYDSAFWELLETLERWCFCNPIFAVKETLKSVLADASLSNPPEFIVDKKNFKPNSPARNTLQEDYSDVVFEEDRITLTCKNAVEKTDSERKIKDIPIVIHLLDLKNFSRLEHEDVRAVGPVSLDLFVNIPNPYKVWMEEEASILTKAEGANTVFHGTKTAQKVKKVHTYRSTNKEAFV